MSDSNAMAMDDAIGEYGVTEVELERFEKRVHGQAKKARQEGKLRTFTGDLEVLMADDGTDALLAANPQVH